MSGSADLAIKTNPETRANANVWIVAEASTDLQALVQMLATQPYTVQTLRGGQDALACLNDAILNSSPLLPRLVLLDTGLTGLDCYEWCRRWQASEDGAEIPVLFLETPEHPLNREKAFAAGAADYIGQPLVAKELLLRISTQVQATIQCQLDHELYESRSLLRLALDTIPQNVFWKDCNSVYLGCNRAFAAVTGLASPTEIVGKTDYDLPWSQEAADFFRACDRKVMTSGQPELGIIEPQTQTNGAQAWLETNKIPLRNAEGRVIGILGTFQNITDLIQTQHSLKEQKEMLENTLKDLQDAQVQLVQSEKMSDLGNLVAGIAHELNNPISFLNGNINPALNYISDLFGLITLYQQAYPTPTEDIADKLEAIDFEFVKRDLPQLITSMATGIGRIRSISESLRIFSRADSDCPVAFRLQDGLESTLTILNHRLRANEDRPAIEVIRNYGDLPEIKGFAGQLNQVFMNLLANAIDALDEANQGLSFAELLAHPNRIWVTTELLSEQQAVTIRIRDNGPGMDAVLQQKIFDRLFTTKGVGKGTGLGLAIAHQIIIEKHQGTITVNSAPGEGAEFVITLPIQQVLNVHT